MSGESVPQTLLGLVQQSSLSGQEEGAVYWLISRMKSLGYQQAFADEIGNAVGIIGEGPRQVVLLGHIDTVPGDIPVRVEDGWLHGRGSVDAKGPLAAFVDAAAQIGALPGWQWVVIGAVGEEAESRGAYHVASQYHPDFAIIGEPSAWQRVTLGYKGSLYAEVTVRQPSVHSAARGASACEGAVEVWEHLHAWSEAFNQGRTAAFDLLQTTLRGMQSGGDGLEEWARLRIGFRLPLDLSPEELAGKLREIAGAAQVEIDDRPIPAYRGGKSNPLVSAFLAGIRAAGGQPGFVLKSGTADINIVAPVWGCPAVAYGPGDSALDHTPEERLELAEYQRAVQVLCAVLQRLGTR
jgi:LysW-gamma-L-lysine carboxypeptidase